MKDIIAFLCPPLQGHINPMSAIAYGLKEKDENVVIKFIGLPDITKHVKQFNFVPIGEKAFPKGSIKKITRKMVKFKGLLMGRVWQRKFANKWSEVVCNELPDIIHRENIDFIVCDQLEAAVALVADFLEIPFITVCNAMAIVMDITIPPFFVSWDYKITGKRLEINEAFYKVADYILKHDTRALEEWRQKWGLPEREGMKRYFAHSEVATLCQQTRLIEFPLTEINDEWYYCGPFRNNNLLKYSHPPIPRDSIKNVYISLGSILGSKYRLLNKCAKACKSLGLRPIIAHAGLLKERRIRKLQRIALIFDYVRQPDIFNECEILISHCGLNTALDALSYGRPIIAIPFGIEQGSIATKLERAGCGVILKRPTKRKIKNALSEILSKPHYIKNAQNIRDEIHSAGGTDKAVEVIYENIQKKLEKVHEIT
jgi:MGT family glycosyltransferase